MKVVIADTSPVNYLVLIDTIEVLPRLYRRIVIPGEVLAEIPGTLPSVAAWAAARPDWLEVQHAPSTVDQALQDLDSGEQAAIILAERHSDVLLLIDDSSGRAEASLRGIPTIGTLGVLRAAAVERFIDLPSALGRLLATNFRAPRSVIADLMNENVQGQPDSMQ